MHSDNGNVTQLGEGVLRRQDRHHVRMRDVPFDVALGYLSSDEPLRLEQVDFDAHKEESSMKVLYSDARFAVLAAINELEKASEGNLPRSLNGEIGAVFDESLFKQRHAKCGVVGSDIAASNGRQEWLIEGG
jgi:hypothetical protein